MVRLVDDDGPGILPDQRQAVLEQGTRLDEQVSGHGLGLGIARDIAGPAGGHHGAEEQPATGGLRVSIELSLQKSGRRQGLTVLRHLPTVRQRLPSCAYQHPQASCRRSWTMKRRTGTGRWRWALVMLLRCCLVFLLGESSGQREEGGRRGAAQARYEQAVENALRSERGQAATGRDSGSEEGGRGEDPGASAWLAALAGPPGDLRPTAPGAIQAVNGQALNCSIRPCWWLARRFSD